MSENLAVVDLADLVGSMSFSQCLSGKKPSYYNDLWTIVHRDPVNFESKSGRFQRRDEDKPLKMLGFFPDRHSDRWREYGCG